MSRRKRNALVPEAREALDRLRDQVIQEKTTTSQSGAGTNPMSPRSNSENAGVSGVARAIGVPYREQDNGDMTARNAGKLGGEIGGPMVKRLIHLAERQLNEAPPPLTMKRK